jgi:hypothetical protein
VRIDLSSCVIVLQCFLNRSGSAELGVVLLMNITFIGRGEMDIKLGILIIIDNI